MNIFKCNICGKFIGYKEITMGKVVIDFTPDSEISPEEWIHTHVKCLINKCVPS